MSGNARKEVNGLLPDILLDSESFDEIFENARNLIVSIYPEWTDFNYHDPGVTMLEMLAWLKDSQHYYLNKIGPENIRTYLKLLGMTRRTKKPSHTIVTVESEADGTAAKGTKLYAGNICFEVDEETHIPASKICCFITTSGGKQRVITKGSMSFGNNLRLQPFPSGSSGIFGIGFTKPLRANVRQNLYFEIDEGQGVPRNPITDPATFIPLVDLKLEFLTGSGWREIPFEDGTYGFLTSGIISFTPDAEFMPRKIRDNDIYMIRFTLTGGEYDELPVIRNVAFGILPVTQRDTKAEYTDFPVGSEYKLITELAAVGDTRVFLKDRDGLFTPVRSFGRSIDEKSGAVMYDIPDTGDAEAVRIVNIQKEFCLDNAIGNGTGLPFQEYDLGSENIEYESFTIMTELPDSGGRYAEWRKVSDFSACGADDFVYVLDTQKGTIRFGDCFKGEPPEGRIFIIGYSETLAANGNVSKGKITLVGIGDSTAAPEGFTLGNAWPSVGGVDEETTEECLVRAQHMLRTSDSVVTDEDCEHLIAHVQGLRIEKCRVLKRGKKTDRSNPLVTTVVVKPYSKSGRGVPGERYIRNILAALEPHRLVGMQYRIVRPEYAGISVYIDVSVVDRHINVRKIIRDAVVKFFRSVEDQFGAEIVYSKLYELIDGLGCIASLNTLTLETDGSGSERTHEGDLLMAPNASAYLKELDIMTNTVY